VSRNNGGLDVAMSLRLEDVMVGDVIKVDVDAKVEEAVRIMNKHEIGCLIVINKAEEPVGIVTERDLLKRVLVKIRDPKETLVSEIMSKPLVCGTPHMDVEVAARLMFKKKIKKLPVVENGNLVGLVTLTDLARVQPEMIRILKKLSLRKVPPKRMKKVLDYYVA
jgi:CBS domain-containing protein